MKNLGGFKREILRGAQIDNNSLLLAHWYEGVRDNRATIPLAHFSISFWFPSSCLGTPLPAKLLLCERMAEVHGSPPRKIRIYLSELWVSGAQMAGPLSRLRRLEFYGRRGDPLRACV